jgi:hypothetical protein
LGPLGTLLFVQAPLDFLWKVPHEFTPSVIV